MFAGTNLISKSNYKISRNEGSTRVKLSWGYSPLNGLPVDKIVGGGLGKRVLVNVCRGIRREHCLNCFEGGG